MKVVFEETNEEREVINYCRRCFAFPPEDGHIEIVSPKGMGHRAADNGETHCGIDATSDGWWHRY